MQCLPPAQQAPDRGRSTQRESRVEAKAIVHDTRSELLSAIEEHVIPRLSIAHNLPRTHLDGRHQSLHALPNSEDVQRLTRLATDSDLQGSIGMALTMIGSGLPLETIFLQLIAPAARVLGQEWEDDLRSFAEVTVGLGTLHELVHTLAPPETLEPQQSGDPSCSSARQHANQPRGRAVLVNGPGEQHTLGLYIFGELLRHARWSVLIEATMSDREVVQHVKSQPVDAVGISVSSQERLAASANLIAAIKRSARNRAIQVLVGGPVDLSEKAEQIGATFCRDACAAVAWLNSHVEPAHDPARELPEA
jgi:methanogenic corrinoid protein MtbC1